MPQPSPLTSLGWGTSQWSTGRETQESEGPWRGEPLQNLRHMPAGGREGQQPSLTSNTRCWEPAKSSPGSQGCLGTAGQCLSCHHPWMTLSFLLFSQLLAGLRTLRGLLAARTTVPDAEQSPDTFNQGMIPPCPCPRGQPRLWGVVHHSWGHTGGPWEVPRSSPAGHRAEDLPRTLMCSQWHPALP